MIPKMQEDSDALFDEIREATTACDEKLIAGPSGYLWNTKITANDFSGRSTLIFLWLQAEKPAGTAVWPQPSI
jgi:hypothetical protein